MSTLCEVFKNSAIKSFGKALRNALREKEAKTKDGKHIPGAQDYASLIELEWVEAEKDFVEKLTKFLHRYNSYAKAVERKYNYHPFVPDEKDLETVVKLVEKHGVKIVKAALISYALVKAERGEGK
jgi:hypothetical protein